MKALSVKEHITSMKSQKNSFQFNRLLLLGCIICLAFSCVNDTYDDLVENNSTLILKWNKAYDEDNLANSIIGLKWTFSYVGAYLPYNNTGISIQNNLIEIDIKKLGFSADAQQKLNKLHEVIISSEEYQVTGAIDIGRYISLLLGAPSHYYEITGLPYELSDLLELYNLNTERGYVTNSGVSYEHRIISFSEQNGFNQLFFCTEVDPITGEIFEYETVDLMPNGQVRFGIYNKDGIRINSTDPAHSRAGKTAKCIWCHESGIQPLFSKQEDIDDFLPYLDLKNILEEDRRTHRNSQNSLNDGVNFQELQQHTFAELLYISFMEPSAERLSLEWNLPISEVQNLLSQFPTHTHPEFTYLGELYHRNDIDFLASFKGLPVSSSIREESENEVNYLD